MLSFQPNMNKFILADVYRRYGILHRIIYRYKYEKKNFLPLCWYSSLGKNGGNYMYVLPMKASEIHNCSFFHFFESVIRYLPRCSSLWVSTNHCSCSFEVQSYQENILINFSNFYLLKTGLRLWKTSHLFLHAHIHTSLTWCYKTLVPFQASCLLEISNIH
jgi:hypothetical protein